MSAVPSLLYTETESDLRALLRDLVDEQSPWSSVLASTDTIEGVDTRLWERVAVELGCVGLPVAEESGGAGGSWSDVAVVMEELGRGVAAIPFFTSAVVATALLQALGADELVAKLASGEKVAALVVPVTQPGWGSSGVTRVDGTVSGAVTSVAGAVGADLLLVVANGAVLVVEAERATIVELTSFDMTRRVADVSFDGARAELIAEGDTVTAALERAAATASAMLASEQLGIAERCLDLAVDYLKQRRQFGRVVGSYQALKHRLADLWTEVTQARAVARYAAACAAESSDDLLLAASVAQSVCGEVAVKAAEECVQLHGGIGFTWEYQVHLYLKRARADALVFGTPAWHRGRIGRLVDLQRPTHSQAENQE